MANELTLAASALFAQGSKRVPFNKGTAQRTVAGSDYVQQTQLAAVSPGAALDLGKVTALGLFIGKNNDAKDSISILTATSGTNIISIPPGQTVMFFFGSGVTAPFIVASANTPELEYLIVEA